MRQNSGMLIGPTLPFSGISVIVASVSNRTGVTKTAFCNAMRTTLVGSTIPASTRSTCCLAGGVKAEASLAFKHLCHDHPAIQGSDLGNRARRCLQRPHQDLQASSFVALTFGDQGFEVRDAAQQGLSATRNNRFGDGGLAGADCGIQRVFEDLHLGLGRRASVDICQGSGR